MYAIHGTSFAILGPLLQAVRLPDCGSGVYAYDVRGASASALRRSSCREGLMPSWKR